MNVWVADFFIERYYQFNVFGF